MTTPAGRWVAARAEQPPAALRERLDAILNASDANVSTPVSQALLEAGQMLLASILASLPLTSVLAFVWLYADTGDTEKLPTYRLVFSGWCCHR